MLDQYFSSPPLLLNCTSKGALLCALKSYCVYCEIEETQKKNSSEYRLIYCDVIKFFPSYFVILPFYIVSTDDNTFFFFSFDSQKVYFCDAYM